MTYHMRKEVAEAKAAELRRDKVGQPTNHGAGVITNYIVAKYTGTKGYGVIERWVYPDTPERGEFGGAFTWFVNEPA